MIKKEYGIRMHKTDYLIVHTDILPHEYLQVIEARELLMNQEVKTVTEAVKRVGISRNTFYKYKDYVFRPTEFQAMRSATISMVLAHEQGALFDVLHVVATMNASVITISQSAPADGKASLLMTLDITHLKCEMSQFMRYLEQSAHAQHVHLDSMQ